MVKYKNYKSILLFCSAIYSTMSIGGDNYNGKYDNFDYFKRYSFIPKAHKNGIKGRGYTISILEYNADTNHPYLEKKLKVINPHGKIPPSDFLHGNHVSAIIIGNENGPFKGGVAPLAEGLLIVKVAQELDNSGSYGMLKALEEAAKKSHIINLSGNLLEKKGSFGLSEQFLSEFKKILIENDSVLVITASNDSVTIGQSKEHQYLVDLTKDPELAKRILIVGNIEYKNRAELCEIEDNLNFFSKKVLPLLDAFVSSDSSLNLETHFRGDFEEYLKKNAENLWKFFKIPEIYSFFDIKDKDNIKSILKLQEKNNELLSRDILNKLDLNQNSSFKDFLESYNIPITQIINKHKAQEEVCLNDARKKIYDLEKEINAIQYNIIRVFKDPTQKSLLERDISNKQEQVKLLKEDLEVFRIQIKKEIEESIRKEIQEASQSLGVFSILSENMFKLLKSMGQINIANYSTSLDQYSALHRATIDSIPVDLYYSVNGDKFRLRKKISTDAISSLKNGWHDKDSLVNKLNNIKNSLHSQLIRIPLNKNESGMLVSTKAGRAAEHFVVAYGQNILSASEYSFTNLSGSSQAAPIVSGMLILCHEYLKYFNKDISWSDLINQAKLTAEPVGENAIQVNKVFGRGLFDPWKLVSSQLAKTRE